MRTYFFLLLISTALSYALTKFVSRAAGRRAAWRDESSLGRGVPRLGGVAIFTSSAAVLALLLIWDNQVSQRYTRDVPLALGLAGSAAGVFLLGLYDDLRGSRPWQKLLVQIGAGIGLFAAGFRVELLTNPFTSSRIELGWLALPVTLLWLVAVSNAFNLIDGLDGLAAGVGVFSTLSLFFLSVAQGRSFEAATSVALAGALLGFLPHNFNPARIYLGDSGSLTIGLVLGALGIAGSQKGPVLVTMSIPLIIFGLPLLDVSVTTLRRFLSGHPIFSRDEEHLHHRLLKIGLGPRLAVLVLYALAGLFALASILLVNYRGSTGPLIALLCGILAWLVVRRMEYPEFAELDAHVRAEWRSQRHVLRNHILLRKAALDLECASSLEELWSQACSVCRTLEFDAAVLELSSVPLGTPRIWRWSPGSPRDPLELGAPPEQMWTIMLPIGRRGAQYAALRLSRRLEREPFKFRVATVIDFFSGPFASRLVEIIEREDQGQVAAVAGSA
jgi:UDP-GlcNAc:undecaprenyl-phosphate GlcNAc-1-phosphate transferase